MQSKRLSEVMYNSVIISHNFVGSCQPPKLAEKYQISFFINSLHIVIIFNQLSPPIRACTMHHCLQIPEILGNICEYLYSPQWKVKGRRSDLLVFALVCKTFLEPSLCVLWKSVGSFARLIKTFPADAWSQADPNSALVSE